MPDFRSALAAAGLSQAAYRRLVERLTDHALDPGTISRRALGKTETPAEAMALLRLLEKPELIKELRR